MVGKFLRLPFWDHCLLIIGFFPPVAFFLRSGGCQGIHSSLHGEWSQRLRTRWVGLETHQTSTCWHDLRLSFFVDMSWFKIEIFDIISCKPPCCSFLRILSSTARKLDLVSKSAPEQKSLRSAARVSSCFWLISFGFKQFMLCLSHHKSW